MTILYLRPSPWQAPRPLRAPRRQCTNQAAETVHRYDMWLS